MGVLSASCRQVVEFFGGADNRDRADLAVPDLQRGGLDDAAIFLSHRIPAVGRYPRYHS